MTFCAKPEKRKNVYRLSDSELVSERVVDFFLFPAIVGGDLRNRVTSLKPLSNDAGRQACAGNHWFSKRDVRIDHYIFALVNFLVL